MSEIHKMGIILRYQAQKRRVCILDHEGLRVDALIAQDSPVTGALITYKAFKGNPYYRIDNVEMIDVPLRLARTDVLFFHHILELCYYFLPVGSCLKDVFEFLCLLYDPAYAECSKNVKNFFIGKLLILIGHYPDLPVNAVLLAQISKRVIDISEIEAIDLKSKQMLHDWIKRCLADHPLIANFNTIHFLMNE